MMNLSNFGNLFPFRPNMSIAHSPINSLLDEPDVTLDKLLDEESFVNDFKIQNPKLMQFMKYDKYKTLLEYITKVGPESEQKRSYKFPFVACQVLTTENNSPAEFLLPEKELFVEEEEIEEVEVEEEVEDQEEVKPPQASEILIEKIEPIDMPKVDLAEAEPTESATPEATQTPAATVEKQSTDPEKEVTEEKPEATETAIPKLEQAAVEPERKPKTHKVLVKKPVIKKTKRQVPPLIGDLFGYIEGELNYTLAGYFSRIVNALFTKKSTSLTNYFFSEPNNKKILDHVDSRSIAEVVIKFLTIDSMSFITERQNLIEDILVKLSTSTNVNLMSNLSLILCEVIDKYSSTVKSVQGCKEMLTYVYGVKFCSMLINNIVSEDEQVSIYNTPVLLCSLVSIRNLIDSKEQSKNPDLVDKYTELMGFLKNNIAESSELSELFKDFFIKAVDKINFTRRKSATIGMGKIKLIECLFFLIKFDFFNIQTVVAQTPFFERLLQLMREYDMNNVLHNEVVKILNFMLELEENHPLLTNLFNEGKLITFLYDQTLEDQKILLKKKESKEKGVTRKGYLGHVVKIGQLINSSTNPQIVAVRNDEKWAKIKELITKETYETEKNLAGYTTRKADANNVMFHKEDIMAMHQAFLSKPPHTIYPEPDIKTDDLEDMSELERKLDQLDVKGIVEETKEKEEQEGMAIFASPSYWKETKSLKYNVGDLMNELD